MRIGHVQMPDSQVQTVFVDDVEKSFLGARLGFGTSRRGSHWHPPSEPPAPGKRCSACRWAEINIFWSESDECYVVATVGRSIVGDEFDHWKTTWTKEPSEVLDALLLPPLPANRGGRGDDGPLEMPQPNEDALEEAGKLDPKLRAEYRAWLRTLNR